MNKEISRPVSTRIGLEEFAKVLDSLIAKGIPKEKLITNSSIVKTAMRMAIVTSPNPRDVATQESIELVKQLWKQNKQAKNIALSDLY